MPETAPMNARCLLFAATFAAALAVGGCATNPVTGGKDIVTISEAQEIEIGRKMHPQILREYGRYDDEALQQYVNSVGQKHRANSHRPNLQYTFTVLDSEEVNAFACPAATSTSRAASWRTSIQRRNSRPCSDMKSGTSRRAIPCASRAAPPRPASGLRSSASSPAAATSPVSPTWRAARWSAATGGTWNSRPTDRRRVPRTASVMSPRP
jgi:hypothetical protein